MKLFTEHKQTDCLNFVMVDSGIPTVAQQFVEVQASLSLLAFYHEDTRVVQKAKDLESKMFVLH